ncbi:GFA family protein [Marinobacter alexandrii]|uniref:GFA family protein n=1 Tax=Marinobacter alexandrii TaxID=2570351 RepID=UPI0011087089|nr:GFA family protein [Marinobacter alexandrii]
MTETTTTSAHCQCGALKLRITDVPVVQLVCHCSDCRNLSGMPYVEAAFFKSDACSADGKVDATTVKGSTGSDKTYYSCAVCKTPLYVRVTALNGAWAVMADRLSPFTFKPQAHIWTSQKADDVQIPTGITQTPERPPKELVDVMVSGFWGRK